MLFSGIVDPATLNLMANMGLANMKIIFYNQAGTYTYTPSPNLLFAEVECIGGGLNTGPGNPPNPAQAGGYARSMISAFEIGTSQQVTVGANQQEGVYEPIKAPPSTFGTFVQGDGGYISQYQSMQTNIGQFVVTGQYAIRDANTNAILGGASFYGYPGTSATAPYLGGGSAGYIGGGGCGCVIITEYIGG